MCVRSKRSSLLVLAIAVPFAAGAAIRTVQDQCGPFTDVSAMLCPYVLEAYYIGITAGTSATTFSPDTPITRGQAAVFTSKGLNQALARGSRRAALGQWWTTTPRYELGLGVTTVDPIPELVACDGMDVWTANLGGGSVSRVRASDGRLLETWTGADGAFGVLIAMGRVFVSGRTGSETGETGRLYVLDPSQPAGGVTVVSDTLWNNPLDLAFDGTNIWVSSEGGINDPGGALSIVQPGASYPWTSTTIKTNVLVPGGLVYDGHNIWFGDDGDFTLKKVDAVGNVIQQVALGHIPGFLVFDGANIWISSADGIVQVVSAARGSIVATLTGNGLNQPAAAAFDGERILVANMGGSLSVWRAADLSPLGTFLVSGQGNVPFGAASDGINFWITLGNSPGQLARF